MDSKNPTLSRRRVSDVPSYVGAMIPVPPSGLSGAATIGTSFAAGLKNFFTGNFAGAIGNAVQVGAQGAEAIENSNALGTFLANSISDTKKFFTGRGTPGLNAAPPSTSVTVGNVPVIFQFFPESITDHRENPIEHISPPGLSLPIPTLAGASERTLTMTLTFARERWTGAGVEPSVFSWDKYNFDVAKCVQAVRSYAYPIGLTSLGLSGGISPQPFMLTLPGTKIGITSDTIGAILRSYNVRYVSFFPDGQPRLAHIDLSMTEVLMDITQNVTGRAFIDVVKSAFAGAQTAIEEFSVHESDKTKGVYGKTRRPDVSTTNEIPPR
jgi:hypothetical protein